MRLRRVVTARRSGRIGRSAGRARNQEHRGGPQGGFQARRCRGRADRGGEIGPGTEREQFDAAEEQCRVAPKQAGKYSKHCRYVAVFDWDAMFIFSFPSAQTNRPVRGLYFDESGRTGGMTFRRLLFAFVVRALRRTKALQLGRGQEDP
ncbi:hypothetical protein BO82DRAFT_432234 [Aspergillus uvarum CBS 121591]|uniref:Uncharacterized protein n=1 Tax=Aspergillus uvarum CBS 121591 TaxID=1448315 RepID=A0A319CDQ6_9EURO|nr:hypothetical protein BO82DRAFT_432234 [Aspergillus uvarum CBS 121591]PYH81841.1 hypothetical protein BO82DRAFT_432234 [Aspergillus uvarum CBS 121591]